MYLGKIQNKGQEHITLGSGQKSLDTPSTRTCCAPPDPQGLKTTMCHHHLKAKNRSGGVETEISPENYKRVSRAVLAHVITLFSPDLYFHVIVLYPQAKHPPPDGDRSSL